LAWFPQTAKLPLPAVLPVAAAAPVLKGSQPQPQPSSLGPLVWLGRAKTIHSSHPIPSIIIIPYYQKSILYLLIPLFIISFHFINIITVVVVVVIYIVPDIAKPCKHHRTSTILAKNTGQLLDTTTDGYSKWLCHDTAADSCHSPSAPLKIRGPSNLGLA
jgi:hypothetical protein